MGWDLSLALRLGPILPRQKKTQTYRSKSGVLKSEEYYAEPRLDCDRLNSVHAQSGIVVTLKIFSRKSGYTDSCNRIPEAALGLAVLVADRSMGLVCRIQPKTERVLEFSSVSPCLGFRFAQPGLLSGIFAGRWAERLSTPGPLPLLRTTRHALKSRLDLFDVRDQHIPFPWV